MGETFGPNFLGRDKTGNSILCHGLATPEFLGGECVRLQKVFLGSILYVCPKCRPICLFIETAGSGDLFEDCRPCFDNCRDNIMI
ncbi:hypothetical protein DPMN_127792 [Dreissena polymorpha]|uniref:Uncharacterized protein n=1 Tax=Dreissena polymorpha TaxID=45954 RepID=A0A9D4JZ43_DREPO|nr:hypothetical protein DPMN_127792 [Dreissena polymorpha]